MNEPTTPHRRTKMIIRVNEEAEKFYSKAQELGLLAVESFREQQSNSKKEQHRSQMTGLENIAETTMKVSDVLDYIKKQTARQQGWKTVYESGRLIMTLKQYQDKCFGEILKTYIENDLKSIREEICRNIGIGDQSYEDQRDRQQVYLHLIRQFVRQIVVQYEYQVNKPEKK